MTEDDFIIGEGWADKPIGYPPGPIIRQALEKTYISIVGAIDIGDFETFLKEVSDLTYDEAKEKMLREYGTQKELSQAKLKAKSADAAFKLELAEQEARAEQRTLQEEFAEIEEVAHRTLTENLDLSRRNTDLERELKRLKEELAKAKVAPLVLKMPVVPVQKPSPPGHGSRYTEYSGRINQAVTMADLNDLANEIYEILEKEEYEYLTKSDTTELLADLRKMSERRAMKLTELKIPEIKPTPEKPKRKEERARVEAEPFMGALPPHVMYRYGRPDMETAVFMDIPFVRDHELERTIIRNSLLLFPPHWFALPPEEKISRYGWDLASAMQHAVSALHKFSWDDLVKDYGIPEKYVEAWKKTAS